MKFIYFLLICSGPFRNIDKNVLEGRFDDCAEASFEARAKIGKECPYYYYWCGRMDSYVDIMHMMEYPEDRYDFDYLDHCGFSLSE